MRVPSAALCMTVLFCAGLRAETLAGPVKLARRGGEKPVAVLDDRARVQSVGSDAKWEYVLFTVVVDAAALSDDRETLKAGTALIDTDGQKLGAAIADQPVYAEVGEDGRFRIELHGVVPRSAIRPESTIEHALLGIITDKKRDVALADLQGHIKEFGYDTWMSQGAITSYYVVDNPEGGARVILVMYEEKLVMVVLGRRHSALDVLKPTFLVRRWGVAHVKRLSPRIEKEVEDYVTGVLRKAD